MGKQKQKNVELLQIENGRTVILFQAINSEVWGMKPALIIRTSQLRPGLTAYMRTPLSWRTWRHCLSGRRKLHSGSVWSSWF